MDALERVITECLQRMFSFYLDNKVIIDKNAKAKAAFTAIGEYVAQLDETGALRTSAGTTKLTQTGFRRMKRTQLYGFLLWMSNNARDIAKNNPNFVNKFRIARLNRNDAAMLEAARAFYADSAAVEQEFSDYGLPEDFRTTLKTLTDEFEEAIKAQDAAKRARVGANASIDDIIDNALTGRRTLLVIVSNLFRGQPGKLAEWTAASHIEKLPEKKKETPKA